MLDVLSVKKSPIKEDKVFQSEHFRIYPYFWLAGCGGFYMYGGSPTDDFPGEFQEHFLKSIFAN
jgi:hypothetical protein